MRLKLFFIVFLGILVSFLFVGCTLIEGIQDKIDDTTDDLTDMDPNIVKINEDINDATIWTDEKVYVIENYVTISSSIEIKPGTVIKFKPDYRLDITGTLKAIGTEASPIIFTSYKDDSHGGDTNKDGNLTTASKGDWAYVTINSNGNNVEHCEFHYGGDDDRFVLEIDSGTTIIKNNVFANNRNGLDTSSSESKNMEIKNNIFYGNEIPIIISVFNNVDDSNIFHNPDNTSVINNKNGILLHDFAQSIADPITWSETEVPFVIPDYLTIDSSGSLTLSDGVIIKFGENVYLSVNGILSANASSKIVFTSYKDDAHGGDTNGDGNLSSPNKNDWRYIYIDETNGSIFNKCEFYYGGYGENYVLNIGDVITTVSNCTFAKNHNGLDSSHYLADPSITNNIFYDNEIPLRINVNHSLDDSNIFEKPGDSSIKNKYQAVYVNTTSSDVEENINWSENEVAYFLEGSLYITSGSLTLGPKVVLKFSNDLAINHDGSNLISVNDTSNSDANYFTSYKDDSKLGDSNGDDDITSPSNNDWVGIWNTNATDYETWSNILYSENP